MAMAAGGSRARSRVVKTGAPLHGQVLEEPEGFEVVVLEVPTAEVERLVGDPGHRLAVRAHRAPCGA